MYVGAYRIELFIPAAQSLKAKRSVVQSLKAKLGQLNVAVAEVDAQELWQRAVLGVAAVSGEVSYLDELPGRMEAIILREPRANLLRIASDVRPVES